MSTTSTFGRSFGSFLGKSAAYAGHAVCATASATGRLGEDVLAGAAEGYEAKSAELSARREQAARKHLAMRAAAQPQAPLAVSVAP